MAENHQKKIRNFCDTYKEDQDVLDQKITDILLQMISNRDSMNEGFQKRCSHYKDFLLPVLERKHILSIKDLVNSKGKGLFPSGVRFKKATLFSENLLPCLNKDHPRWYASLFGAFIDDCSELFSQQKRPKNLSKNSISPRMK